MAAVPSKPEFANGWRCDREDWDFLTGLPELRLETAGAADSVLVDDPTRYIKAFGQKANDCAGQTCSRGHERLYHLRTGRFVDFSAWYAYTRMREIDGHGMGDDGATLTAAAKCAMEGVCPEAFFPYPGGRNVTRIPDAARAEAQRWRVPEEFVRRAATPEACYAALGKGLPVEIGINWAPGLRHENVKGRDRVDDLRSTRGGGHAILLACLSELRVDSGKWAGYHYVWLSNSHYHSYGKAGCIQLHPKLLWLFYEEMGVGAYGGAWAVGPQMIHPAPEADWSGGFGA